MRKVFFLLLALAIIRLLPRTARAEARALGLLTLLCQYLAAATTAANTSKTMSVEQRTGALETRVGNLEQGMVPNLQSGTVIGQMHAGNFATITTTGDITAGGNLGVNGGTVWWPGGVGMNTAKATFLISLSQCGPQSDAGGTDGNTGSTWASGERGYINAAINAINAIHGSLVNHNFMAP